MKKHNLYLLLTGLVLGTHGLIWAQSLDTASKNLKVISYNIYNGFDYGKDTEREQALAEWLASQEPDVVAFQELCAFTEEKLKTYASNWGHDHVVLLKEDGHPVGITSNKPITVKKKMLDGFWHGALHASTHGIDFVAVHLCPSDYATRMRESALISSQVKETLPSHEDPYIILGDFNALSPFDAHLDMLRPELREWYSEIEAANKKKGHQTLLNDQFDYSLMASFLGFPLIDVCAQKVGGEERFSFPAPIHFEPRRNREDIAPLRKRLDYILASPNLARQCVSAKIINAGIVDDLSDHYPVVAEFSVGK